MTATKTWDVRVYIGEHDDGSTHAEARLLLHSGVRAVGTARLHPGDVNIPEIGDELAVARALQALATRLLELGAADVAEVAHDQQVRSGPDGSGGR